MILFPNCKVNLGLHILRKRNDGYHDLDMVMIPVNWCDILEIVPASGTDTTLTISGNKVECPAEKNLVMKAYNLFKNNYPTLPAADIFLHKIIPDGAGLGGGSSDAAFTLIGLNKVFNMGLSNERLAEMASRLGADCPFFIYNQPMVCKGTGTEMTPIEVDLNGYWLAIKKPGNSVSTAQAYSGCIPQTGRPEVSEIIKKRISSWQQELVNDFENTVFPQVPECEKIKAEMIQKGALYASMSGSGSAVFGIFTDEMNAKKIEGAKICAL